MSDAAMKRDEKNRWFDFFALEDGRLLGYVRARIRRISDMDAEDLIGEVMLSIVSKVDTSGPVENIAAYAYRSINNKIADYRRQRWRTVSLEGFADENGEIPLLGNISRGPEDIISKEERKEILLKLAEV